MRAPLPAIARFGLRSVPPAMVKLPVNMFDANGPAASKSLTVSVSASGVMSMMSRQCTDAVEGSADRNCPTVKSLIV